jgi:hypothetical protein
LKRIAYIVAVLTLGCVADHPRSMRELADGRRIPDHWSNFVPTIAQDQATIRLQYDSLYVAGPTKLHDVQRPDGRDEWVTRLYRFFPDGQVLERSRYAIKPDPSPPTAADGDEFRNAGVGRYCVVGDRIRMEFVGFGETGPTYTRNQGHINADGSFTLTPEFEIPDGTFRRVQVGEMKRAADW